MSSASTHHKQQPLGSDSSEMCKSAATKLTVDSALDYLQKAEKVLTKDEFASFLEVIEDFKHQRIPTKTVVLKVKAIFKGKPDSLITDFNMFLPPEHHIKPDVSVNKSENFAVALKLVKKIRERFEKTQPKVLSTFIEILGKFQNDKITLIEARTRVKELFAGQTDLLQEFSEFLPVPKHRREEKHHTPHAHKAPAAASVATADHRAAPAASAKPTQQQLQQTHSSPAKAHSRAVLTSSNSSSAPPSSAGAAEKGEMGGAGGKRKAGERETEPAGGKAAEGVKPGVKAVEPPADNTAGSKRRLVSVSKLRTVFKRFPLDGQLGCSAEKRPRCLRKAVCPRRVDLTSSDADAAFSARTVQLFQQRELSTVVPSALLQKVQHSLRALHSSGASAARS